MEETISWVRELKLARVGLVTGTLQKGTSYVRQPLSVAERVAIIRESAMTSVVVHTLEERRVLSSLKAVFDENFSEFFEVGLC